MLTTLLWIGIGLAVYTAVVTGLQTLGRLPAWISVWGPLITFETRNGLGVLDRLAEPRYRRGWRLWTTAGLVVSLALLVATFGLVLFAAYAALTHEDAGEVAVNRPRNALAIPGVNDFLPLAATPEILVGLFAGLFVHEFGHGVLSRVEGVAVESAGLIFLAVLPFGAFVGVDGDEEDEASTGSRNRIYVAGIANNLGLAAVAFALLFALASTSIAAVGGVAVGGVFPGTPAEEAGLERGDVVTGVDGEAIEGSGDLREALGATNGSVELTVEDDEDAETVTLERSVVVTSTLEGGGEDEATGTDAETTSALEPGETITAVNGTSIATEREFAAALENRTVATLETDDGSTTVVAGVAVAAIDDDGPLAAAGVPAPDGDPRSLVVTRLDGERTVDSDSLEAALADRSPGETVTLEAYVDGQRRTYEVTLAERNGEAVLGVAPTAGTSGITVTDLGIRTHPHEQHLAILRGEPAAGDGLGPSLAERALAAFALPFAGLIDGFSTANFGGFVGSAANFYTATGPLSIFGRGVFLAANALFWTWWLSLLLGTFNCIPCYPLDGAKVLRTTVEAVGSRLGLERPERIGTAAMIGTSAVAAGAILLVLAAPALSG